MDISTNLGQFINQFPKSNFTRKTQVAGGNDLSIYIYFLESGLVKQYCISQSGGDFMTYLFRPGSFFPPTVFSHADLSTCYFEAFTPVTVRIIPLEIFKQFARKNPDLLMDFVSTLSQYFATLSQRINLIAGSTAYQRIAASLVYLGERLGESVNGNGQRVINTAITHRELASWSGTARETASINMKMLENKGLISYQKRRIMINDWDSLLRESGQ